AQRADRGPLETPTRAYRPWTPRNPLCDVGIICFLGMVLVRWSVCVFCVLIRTCLCSLPPDAFQKCSHTKFGWTMLVTTPVFACGSKYPIVVHQVTESPGHPVAFTRRGCTGRRWFRARLRRWRPAGLRQRARVCAARPARS